ncbi:YgaP family membrane protein [Roseisalinus antarcticus]|uniref:Inner membrane protein YgaP-like transmembrane domain-containing protein n=1 Tax=Roseisalinus antarcticus TaxID=254357 RepID=A0A1Y5TB66_9RHOB|nr:DUF2892 domain-containing protein [Roseisalinus antarcticus]SLN60116.1 hypothetical protein ROA7023_02777 [Roseisalinus antarcticus]
MNRNMGPLDRGARIVVALILLYVAFGTGFGAAGVVHWLALLIAAIFAVTSVVGMCPLYRVFGVNTGKG